MSYIKVIQLNCQRSRAVTSNIFQIMSEGFGDVWLLQEPYFFQGAVVGFPGKKTFFVGNEPRTAIVINSDDVDVLFRSDISDRDCVYIWIRWRTMQLALGSIYCPADEDIERSIALLERCKTIFANIPFIVDLDANKHCLCTVA